MNRQTTTADLSLQHKNTLLTGQKRVLEMVATGAPLEQTLTELVSFIEAQEEGMRCGILIVADDGIHFRRGSGPNLPELYHQTLDGVPITPPYLGACGAAAHQCVPVIVPDIENDERWSDDWRDLVLSCNLRSLCSTPVCGSDGRVLASFAMYYDRPRDPEPAHPQLIEIATHLAAIALERANVEKQMRGSEERLARELAAMQQLQLVSSLMIQENDINLLYHRLIDAAAALMHSDAASMQMFDPTRGALRLLAWKGFHPESAAFWQWVTLDSKSSCGAAMNAGRRVMASDVDAWDFIAGTEDLDHYRKCGLRAMQSTPLISRSGRLLGMISTHWRKCHQPPDGDLQLLDVLARQAADLIERAQGEAALRESEELKSGILRSSQDCIKVLDLSGRLLSISGAGLQSLEIEDVTTVLGTSWLEFWPDESGLAATKAFDAALAGGVGSFVGLCPTRSGIPKWWDVVVTPIRDERGEPERILVVSRDTTERKRAEERQKLLGNELNHRVKNTLATVQAIAAQTLRDASSIDEARDTFRSRLIALAQAHDVLTHENWAGADLRDIVAGSIDPHGGSDRFDVAGPSVRLPPRTALSFAMALHELATNATKYGALSAEHGRVEITWQRVGLDGSERLQMRWVEKDGPPVEPPSRKGFGSRMVERALAQELGGQVRVTYERSGVICTIDAPVPPEREHQDQGDSEWSGMARPSGRGRNNGGDAHRRHVDGPRP